MAPVAAPRLLVVVRPSSERARQTVRPDCSFAKEQEFPPALPLVVPSDRLAGTAGDARISERAGAESRKGIPYIHGL
jgi:hypothetical protein